MFYNARKQAIKFYDDYFSMMSEAKYKSKQNKAEGTALKILTPKLDLRLGEKVITSSNLCIY